MQLSPPKSPYPVLADPIDAPPLWAHQARALDLLDRTHRRPIPRVFSLAHEQRTGKSRIVIKHAARLAALPPPDPDRITGLVIVVMPSGAPRNWLEELALYWPPAAPPLYPYRWEAGVAGRAADKRRQAELLTAPGLAVLAVNGEAVLTAAYRKYLKAFLDARPSLIVIDEFSMVMKTPSAKRTTVLRNVAKHRNARHRLILDGTPAGDKPFDVYAPYRFLDWRILGFRSHTAFKAHHAEWVVKTAWNAKKKQLQEYKTIARDKDTDDLCYRNLEELNRKLSVYTDRVRRRDVSDAPTQTFQKRFYQLSPTYRKLYDQLRDEYNAELDAETSVTATHVLTRYLRLQQLLSGYLPQPDALEICQACAGDGCDVCEFSGAFVVPTPPVRVPGPNPRIEALTAELDRAGGDPVVVWVRFHPEIDDVMALGRARGLEPVEYTGRVDEAEKAAAKTAFQEGRSGLIVANQRSAGRAVSFSAARLACYYTNEYSLIARLQSQDRTELLTKTFATGVVDIVAEGTIDEDVVDALRTKRALADLVMNERSGAWL